MERRADHWLYRLTAGEWLAAARNELQRAREALDRGDERKGLFEARRAAGMALNAILAIACDERYGRSYMDHLAALAEETAVPEELRASAARLLARAPAPGAGVVRLAGMSDPLAQAPADCAALILEHAARVVAAHDRGCPPTVH